MLAKIQERYYFFLAVVEALGISFARTKRTVYGLLDILATMASFLFDTETLKNKLYAILLILCTLPLVWFDGDATATVIASLIAVPMFFSKKNWIL